MRKIKAFNFLTINGYFKGPGDDISWHIHGEEGARYSEKQLEADNILLFGRKTYEMMSSFWPTQMAYDLFPEVAKRMNDSDKLVFSDTLTKADWNNTKILSGNAVSQVAQIKSSPGKNITILGSGSVITQLTNARLIDEYEFLIDPVAIGKGTAAFHAMDNNLELTLSNCQVFEKSGAVLLTYKLK